jgi:hypothetical protein
MGVVWTSPNYWYNGSRYGSVSFRLPWDKVLAEHSAFWVGAVEYSSSTALRILLTSKDRSAEFLPYDWKGTTGKGPWWYDEVNGVHYWNGTYSLEFMLERDVPLSSVDQIGFVPHHRNYCSIDPNSCSERGLTDGNAAMRFVSLLVGQNVSVPRRLLTVTDGARVVPSHDLQKAWYPIWDELAGVAFGAPPNSLPVDSRTAAARAVLHALSRFDEQEARALGSLFGSRESLFVGVAELLIDFFGLSRDVDLGWKEWLNVDRKPTHGG